jgi:SPP1 gp7 family putative phage head morphogenesis protein
VVATTRTDARRSQRLAIGAEFNAIDRRVIDHVTSSQGNFVRDEYGRRIESLGEEARRIVAAGLEEGLGRDDIAHALEQAARATLIDRAPFYWETVAASFIAQGRSYAQMSSYAEAGIRQYRIEAVLDEQTTNICRYLHGKTFSVADAIRRFDRIEHARRPRSHQAGDAVGPRSPGSRDGPNPALRGRRPQSD